MYVFSCSEKYVPVLGNERCPKGTGALNSDQCILYVIKGVVLLIEY